MPSYGPMHNFCFDKVTPAEHYKIASVFFPPNYTIENLDIAMQHYREDKASQNKNLLLMGHLLAFLTLFTFVDGWKNYVVLEK